MHIKIDLEMEFNVRILKNKKYGVWVEAGCQICVFTVNCIKKVGLTCEADLKSRLYKVRELILRG